ncbi:MAG: lipid II:glycine glycyltransferase FemX [Candidatus Limnocylindrales bacterium]
MIADVADPPLRVATDAPVGWDALTVDPPGGHVLQGLASAEDARRHGWHPRFATFGGDRAALLLTSRRAPLPGFFAYAPRGPISAGDPPEAVARRAVALAGWCRAQGGTILAVDPELEADPGYAAVLRAAGFHETEEIQPSRHRMVLRFAPGAGEAAIWAGIARSTRQRIRASERDGIAVRHDSAGARLDAFAALMDATARRRHFGFDASGDFVHWWRRVLAAGQARFLVAEREARLLGGLLLYVQGGLHATAFSADDASLRAAHPGTMHLLRWTAIREALAAGRPAIELGGVDLPGARARPRPGDSSWGMYEHKASFGATWLESAAAHEIVLRPLTYRAALALRSVRRALRTRGSVR